MTERNDALSRALAAYAGVTSGANLDERVIRSRVVRELRAPRRRALLRLSRALPLVALFAASAALAATQPALRAAISRPLLAWLSASPRALEPRAGLARAVPVAPSRAAAAPDATTSGQQAPPTIAVEDLPLATPAPETARADFPTEAIDPALDSYRAAHRTHFDRSEPAAALAAWDEHLVRFPSGAFAEDARFNRALCLVRLGRFGEARRALTPFAAASPGNYRKDEAESLLRGLSAAESAAPRR